MVIAEVLLLISAAIDPAPMPLGGQEVFGPPDRSTIRTIESRLNLDGELSRRGCKFTVQNANRYYWTKQEYHGREVTLYPLITEFRIEDVPAGKRANIHPLRLPRAEPNDGGNASGGRTVLAGQFDQVTGRLLLTNRC